MGREYELTGKRFGRLTAMSPDRNGKGRRVWKCQCDCGNITYPLTSNLIKGNTQSCGCLHREGLLKMITKHGMSNSRTYKSWSYMLSRCNNPNDTGYDNYGGRGIKVCPEWHDFEQFLADMGECPDGLTIDRIDYNGHYEPTNCRWVTQVEQANNKRNNRMIEYNGETKTASQWAKKIGIAASVICKRINRGWDVETTLTTPLIDEDGYTQDCRVIEFNGKRLSVADWSREIGIPYTTLRQRLYYGWSVEKTLTTPVKQSKA